MYGEPYWDESAYYQFSLAQIENDLEAPTQEIHQMCLHIVDKVVNNEVLLEKLAIPSAYWQSIADSWHAKDPSLYSRLDFSYDGKSPAKLLENNADTPTSLYETGFWQWLWLEQKVDTGGLSRGADQFNSLQEKLIAQLAKIARHYQTDFMHVTCCKDTVEDRGTIQYLQDCAAEARIYTEFVFVEDIGLNEHLQLTDLNDQPISLCFKLYPWEFMQREEFGQYAVNQDIKWVEPLWKSVLSNKGLLALLWESFEGHPNLLPAYFASDIENIAKAKTAKAIADLSLNNKWVRKPLYSREGANISILENLVDTCQPQEQSLEQSQNARAKKRETRARQKTVLHESDGPYGEEGFVYQAYHPLPKFGDNHTLIGSWLVDNKAAGISLREDKDLITQDLSRFVPHVIL